MRHICKEPSDFKGIQGVLHRKRKKRHRNFKQQGK